jgi:ubiquinone/menaquinone biosynthesis C-methylase UbiE
MSVATQIKEFFTPNTYPPTVVEQINNAFRKDSRAEEFEIIKNVFSNPKSKSSEYEYIINAFGFEKLEDMMESRDYSFFTSMITNPRVTAGLVVKLGDYLVQRIESGKVPDHYGMLLSDATIVIQTRELLRNWKQSKGNDFYEEAGLNRVDLTPLQRNRIQSEMKYFQSKDADGFPLNYNPDDKSKEIKDYTELRNFRRLQFCLNNPTILEQYKEDTTTMLSKSFKLEQSEASRIAALRIQAMKEGKSMAEIRKAIRKVQKENGIDVGVLSETLEERSNIIFNQNIPFLVAAERVGDIGCGNGKISMKMLESDELPMLTEVIATDPVKYLVPEVQQINGFKFLQTSLLELPHGIGDASLDAIQITNVAHHHLKPWEKKALLESWIRKLKPFGRFIFTETTSNKNDIAEFRQQVSSIWLNDIDYNHYISEPEPKEGDINSGGNIPVPGGFTIMSDWVKILESLGMTVTNMSELGFDIPAIRDFHIQMVSVKKPTSQEIIANNIVKFKNAKAKRVQSLEATNKKSIRSEAILLSGIVSLLITAGNFGVFRPQPIGNDMPWMGASNNQNTQITRNIA